MTTRYLIDKSALARRTKASARPVLDDLSRRGLLAVCGAVELEVLCWARSKDDAERIRDALRFGLDWLPMPDEVWDRAIEVQAMLIEQGDWRAVSMPDLLITATAERHRATVLHYDGDYDMIAAVTGQPTRWLVPAGTAD